MIAPRSRAATELTTVDGPNCTIFRKNILGLSSALPMNVSMFFHIETMATQRRLWLKIEAKFRSVLPLVEFRGGEGWAKYLSEFSSSAIYF